MIKMTITLEAYFAGLTIIGLIASGVVVSVLLAGMTIRRKLKVLHK